MTTYCQEFGGDPSSVSLSEVGDAFEGVFANDKEFAREVAKGCGPGGFAEGSWPATCIDWERATSELMESYVEVDGCYFAVG